MTETETTTKQCPFCAETIQAAAIVCRYCGRDLPTEAKPAVVAPVEVWTCPTCGREQYRARSKGCAFCNPPPADDRTLLQQEIARVTEQGWQVVSQTETTVQLKKAKQWHKPGVVLFVAVPLLGALFYGPLIYVAILGLLLVVADYLLKKEQLRFISATDLRQQATKRAAGTVTIITGANGSTCSACGGHVRPDATLCKHCKQAFTRP